MANITPRWNYLNPADVRIEAPPPLVAGHFTVVNPRTGGFRTLRLRETGMPKFFPDIVDGTLVAAYHDNPIDWGSWVNFAFVHQDGSFHTWRSHRDLHPTEEAALFWLINHTRQLEECGREYAIRSERCWICGKPLRMTGVAHPECAVARGAGVEILDPLPPRRTSPRTYEELFPDDE